LIANIGHNDFKTAETLGLNVPPGMLAIADEVSGFLLHLLTAAFGTSRHFAATQHFSRFWSEAVID
jgi:hypothetical protein